ncbi:hypothetical protein BKA62DRAFT_742744 [Auriculariales sp. MPI-PUGE-AT-0066]|nr:hypothetical protein BKA62DRAFT_742744 [Auriculariales sp. MPI-PUGE-AT-0066]
MAHEQYRGDEQFVIGIDLGTTMSAVSYCHLRDGEEPRAKLVMNWPTQPAAAGDCKVPTLVLYDASGKPLLFGRAAQLNEEDHEDAHLAKWFKLWLHPSAMRTRFNLDPPPLPPNVTIAQVYADFLRFLFAHTQESLENTIGGSGGDSLWMRFKVAQQAVLRQAAVDADILPAHEATSRVTFVPEAEASVHFAIAHADIGSWLRKDSMFLVTDAGGSTVDTVVYKCMSASPKLTLSEATSSECVQAGSAMIDQAAEQLFKQKLRGSAFDDSDTLEAMLDHFEQNAKRSYEGASDGAVVKTGRLSSDKAHNITKGRLRLSQLFAGPLDEILSSIDRAVRRTGHRSNDPLRLLTVGGFAESAKLRSFLKERLAAHNITVVTIDEPTKKAAAEGAVYWYARKFVVARAARKSYGINCQMIYDSSLPEHQARSHLAFQDLDGSWWINNHFYSLVVKNQIVKDAASTQIPFQRLSSVKPNLSAFEVQLYCIDKSDPSYWHADVEGDVLPGYERVCTLKADMSTYGRSLQPLTNPQLQKYWRIDFVVEVFFGQTMLCANVAWKQGNKNKKVGDFPCKTWFGDSWIDFFWFTGPSDGYCNSIADCLDCVASQFYLRGNFTSENPTV